VATAPLTTGLLRAARFTAKPDTVKMPPEVVERGCCGGQDVVAIAGGRFEKAAT
jgi:hypothetical protein